MKINGNEIRPGNILHHKNSLWVVVKVQHVKPGKGGAFAQVELKNLTSGTKLNERFRSSETVDKARVEERECQFLYESGPHLVFMDLSNYDQFEMPKESLGEQAIFLQEGMTLKAGIYEEQAVTVALPGQVTLSVEETEPVIKGQTAANSNKPAILENGMRVMVPPFVGIGDKVVVDTAELRYVRRGD